MKGIKLSVALAAVMATAGLYAIEPMQGGVDEGDIVNGLKAEFIDDIVIYCVTGQVIPGSPLRVNEALVIKNNFTKIKYLIAKINGKNYKLDACWNDEMDNQLKLDRNRHFDRLVIMSEGAKGKYYLQCVDRQEAAMQQGTPRAIYN